MGLLDDNCQIHAGWMVLSFSLHHVYCKQPVVICYLRVYCVGHAGTSAKQRIGIAYLWVMGKRLALKPYLGKRVCITGV